MGRHSAVLNLVFACAPFTLAMVLLVALGMGRLTGLLVALALAVASLASLVVLKLPAIKAGTLIGFGPRQASQARRWLWWLAFALLWLSMLFASASGSRFGT